MSDWRSYERFVAGLMSDEHASDEFTVIPNARIHGVLSGTIRQIDVLIDAKWDEDTSRRIIVDAKRYKGKIDVKDVEMFEGMMRDCRAQYGIIVCTNGYSEAALRRAKDAITIKLVPLSDLDDFSLSTWEPCLGKCSSVPNSSNKGLVLYDSPYGLSMEESPLSIVAVGKCDVCTEFHIWCWECGQKFALGNEDEHRCGCKNRFWLTSIEQDEDVVDKTPVKKVNLLLILSTGAIITVDRRKLQ